MTIRFRITDKRIFNAIRSGKKKIETRAGTVRYINIQKDEFITLMCGKQKFQKKVKKIEYFRTIGAMLKKYKPKEINPFISTEKELREMYGSFYSEKIKKNGLIAWTF